ncbi:MAG: TonB-dependent receptor plug domain-containing protein [Gammaproteobacteria bacterium]
MRNDSVRWAVRSALIGAATATFANASVLAQQESASKEVATVGSVVVTGTRIQQPNLTSISPVIAVSAEAIKIEGVSRIEDLINRLPQAAPDQGGFLSNEATGTATVDLRGLGPQRTLVLVNGRRLMPGDPTLNGDGAPDLNQIPGALIERIEVLTGGASAVYGADAVAGVVNFIMNDHFEGVRLDAQYSMYQHHNDSEIAEVVRARGFALPDDRVVDGYATDITFTLGVNMGDGRGHATVYAGYRELDALLQSERDYSACALSSGDTFTCGGTTTTSPPRLQAIDNDPASPMYSVEVGPAHTFDPTTGVAVAFDRARHAYNFAPLNYYQRPDERYTAGLFAHYDISERMKAYTEFAFMDDRSLAQIAPTALFRLSGPADGGAYILNCDNPFLTLEQFDLLCASQGLAAGDDALVSIAKRNVEGGGRVADFKHTSYRGVLGARGDFAEGWSYDVYGLYGTTDYTQEWLNDFSKRRTANALLAVREPADPNGIVCRANVDADAANDDPTCVPYNPFQPGGVTQDALDYIQTPGFQTGSTTESIASGAITGDLGPYGVRFPWANDGLGVALGAEYRREEAELRVDAAFATNDLSGQGRATLPIAGAFDVIEGFVEARLPIAQDKAFARVLSLEAGYRYSDYSPGSTTDTYKVGAHWAPTEDIRVRVSFQRAVRAPNIPELYRPQVLLQGAGTTDPCAVKNPGVDMPSKSLEECARTGVTAAQYGFIAANSDDRYNSLVGGSTDLDSESADTYSLGLVLTPRFLAGLSLSVDYFDIKVEDIVSSYGYHLILNNCLDTGDPQWCTLVHRAPGSGSLWTPQGYVIDLNSNTGRLQTKGVDLEANYGVNLQHAGRISFQLIGTYLEERVSEPVTNLPAYDCVGLYGGICGLVPEFRSQFRTTWVSPWDLDVALTWRFIDSVDLDSTSDNPQLAFIVHATDVRIDSVNFLDLAASYSLKTGPANMTFRLGINNLMDEDPPVFGGESCPLPGCNGNTFPQMYDPLGRYVFFNVTADF